MFETHATDAVFSNYIASQAACPAYVEQYFKWDKPAAHKFTLITSNATCFFNTQVGMCVLNLIRLRSQQLGICQAWISMRAVLQ